MYKYKYDYYVVLTGDILAYVGRNIDELRAELSGLDEGEIVDYLQGIMWLDDSVTGNRSGSYTMGREEAKSCVLGNMDLMYDAANHYGNYEDMLRMLGADDWELVDVVIRCSLLPTAIDELMPKIEDMLNIK